MVVGSTAQLMGTGSINGAGEYPFLVTVVDDAPDALQVTIWDAGGGIVYDTAVVLPLGGGNITIHK